MTAQGTKVLQSNIFQDGEKSRPKSLPFTTESENCVNETMTSFCNHVGTAGPTDSDSTSNGRRFLRSRGVRFSLA